MRFQGKVGFTFSADVEARKIGNMKTKSKVTLQKFDIVSWPDAANVPKLLGPFEHSVVQPETDYVFTTTASKEHFSWVSLPNVSPYVVKAIRTNEDGSFYSHKGFSWRQMKAALQKNIEERRYVRGASTVSMQLVKNIFFSHEKTIARKLQEALLTFAMEQVVEVPKDRIMEIYLNIIEWGPNVYGIQAAARHYFGVHPRDLSLEQSTFLVTVIPGPRKYHHYYRHGISDKWWDRMQRIMRVMVEREHITQEEYNDATLERPPMNHGRQLKPISRALPRIPID